MGKKEYKQGDFDYGMGGGEGVYATVSEKGKRRHGSSGYYPTSYGTMPPSDPRPKINPIKKLLRLIF